MSINSTTRKIGPLLGNGVANVFAFPFKVLDPADILAVWYDGTAEADLVYDVDYGVVLNSDQNANPGGTVTLSAALASGTTLIITSDQPDLQPTDITNQGGFYPEVITTSLDRACIDTQELQEQADRSLRYSISDPPTNAVLPPAAQRAGKNLSFDVSGNMQFSQPWEVMAFAGGLLGAQDGVNTIFTLTNNGTPLGQSPQEPIVWVNYPLIPGSGYTLGPGIDQVTFAVAPHPTDILYGQGWVYFVAPVPSPPASQRLFSGPLLGPQNLVNTVFTLSNNGNPIAAAPEQVFVWQNFPLAPGVGYTMGPSPNQVTFANPPGLLDTLYAQGILPGGLAGIPNIVIPGTQDLNTLTAAGVYYLPDGIFANAPNPADHTLDTRGCLLEIFNYTATGVIGSSPTYILQRLQTANDWNAMYVYERWYFDIGGTYSWTGWKYFAPAGAA